MDEPRAQSDADHFRLLTEGSSDVIARIGPDMRFVYISPAGLRMFGRSVEDTIGQSALAFTHPDDIPAVLAATARLMSGETDSSTVTTRVLRGDGTWQWTETTSRPIGEFEPGELGDRVLVMRDVTDRKALEELLTAMAMKDGLTGLANRRAFDETLDREWRRTVREKSQMSVVLIDIDFFKPFNDAYGHQVGDDCLKAVGSALLGIALRPGDLVARYGGEELAIILAHSDAQGAAVVAERARSTVQALGIPHEGTSLPVGVVTASVGVATALAVDGGSADLPSALVIAADRALYGAKKDGRNLVKTGLVLARPL